MQQIDKYIKTARWLGYLGLLPFIICLSMILLSNDPSLNFHSQTIVVLYAALILNFVAAIHWGILLNAKNEQRYWLFIVSILPTIVACLAVLAPFQYGLGILFFSFLALYHYEKNYLWQDYYPEWFQILRSHLNFAVSGILLVIWIISLS